MMDLYSKIKENNFTFVLISLLFAQLLYLNVSLSVDEAFYLVKAESILNGSLIRGDSWEIGSYPVFYGILSLVLFIFGKSVIYTRIMLFIVNGLNAIILFKIGTNLFNEKVGKLASILLLIGFLMPEYESYIVLTEPFMLFFGLLGMYTFLKFEKGKYLIISGFLFSLSSLCKTTGLFYIAAVGLYFILDFRNSENQNKEYIVSSIKKMLLVIIGFTVPIFIGYLYFYHIDSLSTYFIIPMMKFVSTREHQQLDVRSLVRMFKSYSIIWFLSSVAVCIFACEYIRGKYDNKTLFIIINFIFSLFPLSSRQYGHYIIPVLPLACILASICVTSNIPKPKFDLVKESLVKRNFIKIFAALCIIGMITTSFIYNVRYMRSTLNYEKSRYEEQIETSDYIKFHTTENDSIFVLGYEPSVYYLSERKPLVQILIFDKFRYSEKLEDEIIDKLKSSDVYVIQAPFYDTNYFVNLEMFVNNSYEPVKSFGEFKICKKMSFKEKI